MPGNRVYQDLDRTISKLRGFVTCECARDANSNVSATAPDVEGNALEGEVRDYWFCFFVEARFGDG
jgi:hypothetical protein